MKPAGTKPSRRVRKIAKHTSFRLSKNIKPALKSLPSSWLIFKKTIKHVWMYKKLYGSLTAIHGLLILFFIRGADGGFDITNILGILGETGNPDRFADSLSIVGAIFTNIGDVPSEVIALYQFTIFLTISMATIWAVRHTRKHEKITVKQAFYNGMTPLIPFGATILLLLCMFLPLVLANFLYTVVFPGGLAVTFLEQFLWAILIALIVLLSIYLFTSSIFAMYIVTMPGMGPIIAIRSSRNIVRFRRLSVLRKILFLPVILSLITVLVLLPTIMFLPVLAEPFYYIIASLSLIVMHAYFYNLYRELL